MDSSSAYMYHQPYIHHGYASLFLESTPLPSPHTVFLCQTLFNLFFLLSLCNDRWWWQLSLPWLRIPLLSVLYYCSVQKYGKVVVHKWNFLCLSHNLSPDTGFTSFRSQNRQWVGGPQIDLLTIIWVFPYVICIESYVKFAQLNSYAVRVFGTSSKQKRLASQRPPVSKSRSRKTRCSLSVDDEYFLF